MNAQFVCEISKCSICFDALNSVSSGQRWKHKLSFMDSEQNEMMNENNNCTVVDVSQVQINTLGVFGCGYALEQ